MLRLFPLVLSFLVAAPGLAQPVAPDAPSTRSPRQLARAIERVLAPDSLFGDAHWTVYAFDLERDRPLYRYQSGKNFVPASNTKLYTTAAALDQLGPDFRYRTVVYVDGPVVDGTLRGNLIVRGSGDPVIGGRYEDGDRTAIFRRWAEALRAEGITHIAGDIIGDDDRFDDTRLGYGWEWEDLTYWYAAELGALSFNDNTVDVTIEARQPGEPARVTWQPATDYVDVVNATVTVAADGSLDGDYERPLGTNTIRVGTRIPAGRTTTISLPISNPTAYFVHVLREALVEAGVAVSGRALDVDALSIKPDYRGGYFRPVAEHHSAPLADIVEVVNKRSHNLYADQLLKTLGLERPAPPAKPGEGSPVGSARSGIASARETFGRAGLDTTRLHLRDGSGLSRHNLVTAEMTGALLRYMWHHPDSTVRTAFIASLPVGGIDGTLSGRYPAGQARENVRAKTGTLSSASALGGYVTTQAGTPLAFVIMCNHFTVPTSAVREAQDQIVELLSRYRR